MQQNEGGKERKKSTTSAKLKSILRIGDQQEPPTPPPPTDEELYPEDTDTPDVLPILHRNQFTKLISKSEKKEDEYISTQGRLKYKETMDMLTCKICCQLVTMPLIQCRKGHIYCRGCKHDNKIVQCKICKQTFVDAPNVALDQLISFIAIPCKYSSRGCQEFVFLDSRLQHETLCRHRPIHCQYEERGCDQVFSMKDMCWHHKMCQYATFPHPNVLPNMPSRKHKTMNAANGKIKEKTTLTNNIQNGDADMT